MATQTSVARRINYSHLSQFIGQTVRLVGQVVQNEEEGLQIMIDEGSYVTCHLSNEKNPLSLYIEIMGEVQDDLSIVQNGPLFELGDCIDLNIINKVINLTFEPKFLKFFGAESVQLEK